MPDFKEIDDKIQELSVQKFLEIEKALKSDNPKDIITARRYLEKLENKQPSQGMKAFMFEPYEAFTTGTGFKDTKKRMGFSVQKKVAEVPYVWLIHKTRIFQVQNFLKFTTDDQSEGYTIRRKLSRFEERDKEVSDEDKVIIEYIADFLDNSRKPSKNDSKFDHAKWDDFDDFDDFVRLILKDSLTYDFLGFENQRSNSFDLLSYKAVDASTIRYLNTIDPNFSLGGEKDIFGSHDKQFGYFPRYCQVWSGQIQNNPITEEPIVWYPWELSTAIRNKTTDIGKNFYGVSEIEIASQLISWILFGMDYNGNFFKQGSNAKGILNFKGDNVDQNSINQFRNFWRTTIAGVDNSHKIPVIEGLDVEWIDLQKSNKDMEFQPWLEFLLMIFCSVYSIDPSELGLNFKNSNQMFGERGQKERLEHSREKGLKPILLFIQKVINKFIVSEIHRDFEFVFTGIDLEDEEAKIKTDKLKLEAGVVSLQDMFKKYSHRELNEDDDIIVNQIFYQYKQMMLGGSPESNAAVDEMNKEAGTDEPENVFDEYEKASEQDPIIKETLSYIDNAFKD